MGTIKSLHKKGDPNKTENYRRIILINTVHKIYAMVIEKRLKQESDDKERITDNQLNFRKEAR